MIEQSVTTEDRKKQRIKYSQPLPDGDRALVIRWHQTVNIIVIKIITCNATNSNKYLIVFLEAGILGRISPKKNY